MTAPHTAVLAREVLRMLDPKPGDTVVDATLGAGGHAELILERTAPDGILIGIDMDPAALAIAQKRLVRFADRLQLFHGAFDDILLHHHDSLNHYRQPVHVLFDLGVSSFALDDVTRGISFLRDGPLDMRFNPQDSKAPTAASLLTHLSKDELATIFRAYGEEQLAGQIAAAIIATRNRHPIMTTGTLAELVNDVYAKKLGTKHGRTPHLSRNRHPATKVFQALRIAANDELGRLQRALPLAVDLLSPGSRITVISFHSLEDRIVKTFFRERSRGEHPLLRLLTKKPVTPTKEESESNPRSRSAKLRAAEKIHYVSTTHRNSES